MPLTFPSPEWVAEFEKQINASPEYKASSLTWEAGPLTLVGEADPEVGQDYAEVFELATAVVVDSRRQPGAPEVEADRCPASVGERMGDVVGEAVVHRAAVDRVRMTDHGGEGG